jgi:hypothetical protein
MAAIEAKRSFLEDIGFELVKAPVIAAFVVVSLYNIDGSKLVELLRPTTFTASN